MSTRELGGCIVEVDVLLTMVPLRRVDEVTAGDATTTSTYSLDASAAVVLVVVVDSPSCSKPDLTLLSNAAAASYTNSSLPLSVVPSNNSVASPSRSSTISIETVKTKSVFPALYSFLM